MGIKQWNDYAVEQEFRDRNWVYGLQFWKDGFIDSADDWSNENEQKAKGGLNATGA